MNVFIFAILIAVYLFSLTAISLKLRDILKNPHKYQETALENKAYQEERKKKHCWFFQSLSHQYSFVSFAVCLLLTVLSAGVLYGIFKLIAGNSTMITPGPRLLGVSAMFFLNIALGMVILPLHIKTTFFAVAVKDAFNGSRYSIWKKSYITLLIFFAITFPLYALSANHYIFYDHHGVTASGFFEITETYTAYEDIEEVRISIHRDRQGNASSLNYEIKQSNGRWLELNTTGYYNQKVLEIHKILETKENCKATVETPTQEDIAYIENHVSKETLDIVKYIFEGFHRS